MTGEASLAPAQTLIERAIPLEWRIPLFLLLLAWAGLSLFFASDWVSMARQWWDASTYNHILLIPPVLVWLVWLRRSELAQLCPRPWWPGLMLLLAALFLWLIGAASGINTARHLGLVAAMAGAAIALLGPRISAALAFPMAYAFFLVPIGDELVPALQMITAKISIILIEWSGIPAEIDGVFIDTPAGLFEVAEACSGVKFLVAMIALGALVCNLCFRSWWRRVLFMLLGIVVPIVANGVRAWGIIYIAQSRGVEFAAGVDHIVYGWIFFAMVIAILLGLGWRFFDRAADAPFVDVAKLDRSQLLARLDRYGVSGGFALAAILALGVGANLWAGAATRLSAPIPSEISLPDVPGWSLVEYSPAVWWEPRAAGADHRLLGRYRDRSGREVDVFYAIYRTQDEGREAGGHGEGALMPDSPWRWVGGVPPVAGGSAERMQADTSNRRMAITWYRNGGILTGDNRRLKLAVIRDRLALSVQPTLLLIISAEERPNLSADSSLRRFIDAIDPVAEWMDATAGLP